MKKIVYIGFVVFGLGVVSCQKEVPTPNNLDRQEVPVWVNNNDKSLQDDGSAKSGTVDDGSRTVISIDGAGITDPNNDPDGNNTKGKGAK